MHSRPSCPLRIFLLLFSGNSVAAASSTGCPLPQLPLLWKPCPVDSSPAVKGRVPMSGDGCQALGFSACWQYRTPLTLPSFLQHFPHSAVRISHCDRTCRGFLGSFTEPSSPFVLCDSGSRLGPGPVFLPHRCRCPGEHTVPLVFPSYLPEYL